MLRKNYLLKKFWDSFRGYIEVGKGSVETLNFLKFHGPGAENKTTQKTPPLSPLFFTMLGEC